MDSYYQTVLDVDANDEGMLDAYLNSETVKTAYHKEKTSIVELEPRERDNDAVQTVDDLLPALNLINCDNIEELCKRRRITYRRYDGESKTANDLKRMLAVGTHLPVFISTAYMQMVGFSQLELNHIDPRFSIILRKLSKNDGRHFRNIYDVHPILAGGHGDGDDADGFI
mmetsp:Transcript_1424/g.2278  ORF Transcript_1424/g.2278 Transcript_1424/m.2278 type:complete len:170 (+) Transcript_1424:77-586(+)|eukprot:CAMPEP_0185035250 /NCGR_PEP_ID=MMETSP1103-20130426/26316_1 /TAXON_ID=36769 /ORGANISM="Paraphysomonas bandaiensis, Strain Caron Lab Isolate" /LENGTH=169 /DNA_ID=CAMNT_0027572253 /DNA_START=45 /DNA_END=554 /DNA_ORIENTATION=-